jgi:hypothetical protein
MKEIDSQALLSKPLRSLTNDDLSKFATCVLLTVGTEDDFRYFLPRILELLILDEFSWPDPEVLLARLPDADWSNWDKEERTVLTDLFSAIIISLANSSENPTWDIDDWICGIARCVDDILPYLEPLLELSACEQLVEFYRYNEEELKEGGLFNSFCNDVPENKRKFIAWWQTEQVQTALNEGLKIYPERHD